MKRTVTVDDLDGSDSAETVQFGLRGRQYEIDLSEANARRLDEALMPFIAAGRLREATKQRSANRTRKSSSSRADRARSLAIREWAAQQGHDLNPEGRIPNCVVAAYDEACASGS